MFSQPWALKFKFQLILIGPIRSISFDHSSHFPKSRQVSFLYNRQHSIMTEDKCKQLTHQVVAASA